MLKKTHTEEVAVRDRFTNEVKFTATVECAPDALPSLKLGLAVKWGLANGADLRSADLRSANLGSADLGSADLRSANLGSANLGSADLGSADLRSANLGSANLGSADLGSADLGSADLHSANLRSANLGSADLRSADLRFANLRFANLRFANLRFADLRSAELGSADLHSANLRSAKYGDQVLVRPLARATRISDGYEAIAFEVKGGGVWIKGGCKWLSLADFRAKADAYDTDTRAETHEILDYIERAAVRLGAITPIKPARSRAKAIKAVQVAA